MGTTTMAKQVVSQCSVDQQLADLLDLLASHLDLVAGGIPDLDQSERALLCRRLARVEVDVAMLAASVCPEADQA